MTAAARVQPNDYFNTLDWKALTARSGWRGPWLVLHCWAVIGAAMVVG
ncbi:MAG: fatty acid desaturase, partial [Herminiimonas sp.]|nr:fatty acid desaturase [Herminiimonas sp.]